jgi:hypothetical protein
MAKSKATQSERRDHVQAWEASELSARAYGARAGVNANTLVSWRWQQRRRGEAQSAPPMRGLEFVELRETGSGGERDATIELRLEGLTVRVPDGFEVETLRRVLSVLAEAGS